MKLANRIIVYVVGILILALGTVLFTKSGLGVSAIVSVAFTLDKVTPISFGMCTTIVYSTFVIIEMILYKEIKLNVLLQIPFSFVFGAILDLYKKYFVWMPDTILTRSLCLVFALVGTAVGISMMLKAKFIVNPPDGIVQALSTYTKKDFGVTKWIFDGAMVVLSAIIGLVNGIGIAGIGVGTVIAVFTIGNMIKFINQKIFPKISFFNEA